VFSLPTPLHVRTSAAFTMLKLQQIVPRLCVSTSLQYHSHQKHTELWTWV